MNSVMPRSARIYGGIIKEIMSKTKLQSMAKQKLEEEWGSSEPIGLWNPTLFNSLGQEIQIPSCEKCGSLMQMVIGREVYAWYCTEC